MFGSQVLEVAIGVVFIFILVSTLCTAVREGIEVVMKSRAVFLERGIRQLLHDDAGVGIAKSLYEHPLIFSLFSGEYVPPSGRRFLGIKLPRSLFDRKLPSYIPSKNFAIALLDLAARGTRIDAASADPSSAVLSLESVRANVQNLGSPPVQRLVLTAIDTAQGDLNKAQANLEAWFDSGMDRVSGCYKRSTYWWLFLIGLIVAAVLNVDTISIARYLSSNEGARKALVAKAEAAVKEEETAKAGEPPAPPGASGGAAPEAKPAAPALGAASSVRFREALQEFSVLQLPVGWQSLPGDKPDECWCDRFRRVAPQAIFGWLLTALAATLGAPFWFDTLNKLMVIRSTVKPHEKSKEEASEDRQRAAAAPPAAATVPAGGAAAGPAGNAAGAAPAPVPPEPRQDVPAPPDEESDIDGCDVEVHEDETTADEDLPAAEGGVA